MSFADLRKRQLDSLQRVPGLKTIVTDSVYSCPVLASNSTAVDLFIKLPPAFPSHAPELSFSQPVRHQMVNEATKRVESPTLAKWSTTQSVADVINSILNEFRQHPPMPAGPSAMPAMHASAPSPAGYNPYPAPPPPGYYGASHAFHPPGAGPAQASYAQPPFGAYPPPPAQAGTYPPTLPPPSASLPAGYGAGPSPYPPYHTYQPAPAATPTATATTSTSTSSSSAAPMPAPSYTPPRPPGTTPTPTFASVSPAPSHPASAPPAMPSRPAPVAGPQSGPPPVFVPRDVLGSIPQLADLTPEELQEIHDRPEKRREFFALLPAVVELTRHEREARARSKALAEQNLARKDEVEAAQRRLVELSAQLEELRRQTDQRNAEYQALRDRFSDRAIVEALRAAEKQADTNSERLAEDFVAGTLALEEFCKKYVAERKLYHLRHAKLEIVQRRGMPRA